MIENGWGEWLEEKYNQTNEAVRRMIDAMISYGLTMSELDEILQRGDNDICADDLCRDDFGEFQPSDKPIEFLLGIPVNNKGGV